MTSFERKAASVAGVSGVEVVRAMVSGAEGVSVMVSDVEVSDVEGFSVMASDAEVSGVEEVRGTASGSIGNASFPSRIAFKKSLSSLYMRSHSSHSCLSGT